MYYRAIRGATTVKENTLEAILEETSVLLEAIMAENQIGSDDLVSILFTTTPDLTAAFPAKAARRLGLSDTPLICAQELDVKGALPRCIRVMIHAYTSKSKQEIKHIYLNEAVSLRVDA